MPCGTLRASLWKARGIANPLAAGGAAPSAPEGASTCLSLMARLKSRPDAGLRDFSPLGAE
jgi:hypothetical protein